MKAYIFVLFFCSFGLPEEACYSGLAAAEIVTPPRFETLEECQSWVEKYIVGHVYIPSPYFYVYYGCRSVEVKKPGDPL